LDTAWSPFDDNLVVSGSEDGKSKPNCAVQSVEADESVCIWKVQDSLFEGWGEEGWVAEDFTPDAKLNAGGRYILVVLLRCT
jgi:coronin-1B/1C/6